METQEREAVVTITDRRARVEAAILALPERAQAFVARYRAAIELSARVHGYGPVLLEEYVEAVRDLLAGYSREYLDDTFVVDNTNKGGSGV